MRYFLFLFVATLFSACGNNSNQISNKSREACLNDSNTECWCSRECGYRTKEKTDKPIYIENDRNGKFCYCNQWDLDHYKKHCAQRKNANQPSNAE